MSTPGQQRKIDEAFQVFRAIEPLWASGQHQLALEKSTQLERSSPKWAYSQYAKGNSLALMGRFEDARRSLRRAISIKGDDALFHAKLGEVLHRLDDSEGAQRSIDQAISLSGGEASYMVSKAYMLRLSGHPDQARELLGALYEDGNRDHRLVRIYASILAVLGEPERGIEVLEPLVEAECSDAKIIAAHCYVLAKLYDRVGRYDDAYAIATRGAGLNGKSYDAAGRMGIYQDRVRAWDESAMAKLARSRVSSEKPVFIVGMPRSGTTLVEQILTSHPEVYGAGELINIFVAAQELATPSEEEADLCRVVDSIKAATLDRTARRILRDMEKQVPRGTRPSRICDKLLLNFQHLGLIEQLFPSARVIFCHRDPLDTFISSYLLDFEGPNAHAYTDRPEWFAHFYALSRLYLDHWKQVCSITIHEVHYEQIIDDQRGTTERLLGFLGLDFDEACMSFHTTERAVNTASTDQVRKALYTSARARHLHYEKHLGPVREALAANGVTLK